MMNDALNARLAAERFALRETLRSAELRFPSIEAVLAHLTARGIAADTCYICDTQECDDARALLPADEAKVKAQAEAMGEER